eukprot:g7249.t1
MAMFPQFGAMPGVPAASGSAPLLSFKAGKMKVSDKGGDKFHITPDLRKGTISLFKGPDDQLMHFSWKERPSGNVVDDVIILPEEAVYKKVDTGREGERVYLMEIAGNRRFFYWMQDKDADKDEENMKKVNELTNSPPPDDAPASRSAGAAGTDMMGLLSSMGGGAGGAGLGGGGGGGTSGGSGGANEQLNIQNLQSILQNMGFSAQEQACHLRPEITVQPATSTPGWLLYRMDEELKHTGEGFLASGAGGGLTAADFQRAMMSISGMMPQQRKPPISLNDVVDADKIEEMGVLEDPETQRLLLPLLPKGGQTVEELRETIRSPQLQQALQSLGQALHSDNFNNIMSSFELDPSNPESSEAMARGDPVEAFLRAMMHSAAAKKEREAAEAAAKQEEGGNPEADGGDGSKTDG